MLYFVMMVFQSIFKNMAEYFVIFSLFYLYFLKTCWDPLLIFTHNFAQIVKWEAEELDRINVTCLIHLTTKIPPVKHSS